MPTLFTLCILTLWTLCGRCGGCGRAYRLAACITKLSGADPGVSRVSGHPPFWLGCPFWEENFVYFFYHSEISPGMHKNSPFWYNKKLSGEGAVGTQPPPSSTPSAPLALDLRCPFQIDWTPALVNFSLCADLVKALVWAAIILPCCLWLFDFFLFMCYHYVWWIKLNIKSKIRPWLTIRLCRKFCTTCTIVAFGRKVIMTNFKEVIVSV